MISAVWQFLESYGWIVVLGTALSYAIYANVLQPKIEEIKAHKDAAERKKFDDNVHSKVASDVEKARLRQQEEHDRVSSELRELEEKRKAEKLAEYLSQEKGFGTAKPSFEKKKKATPAEIIESYVVSKPIVIFSKTHCPFCRKVKSILSTFRLDSSQYVYVELDERDDCEAIQQEFIRSYGSRSVPKVFINKSLIGGCDDTVALNEAGALAPLIEEALADFA
ncbi:unnamed protein product [Auanema sp. JU1783]|nr:unnamed protein product [Auanema sp. JU1783]